MGSVARATQYQQTHFIRGTVLFNSPNVANGVVIGRMPMGALLSSIDVTVYTAQNAGTTNTVSVGTIPAINGVLQAVPAAQNNLVNAAPAGAAAFTKNTPTIANQQANVTDQAIVVSMAQSGTAATAGQVYVVVTYFPNL